MVSSSSLLNQLIPSSLLAFPLIHSVLPLETVYLFRSQDLGLDVVPSLTAQVEEVPTRRISPSIPSSTLDYLKGLTIQIAERGSLVQARTYPDIRLILSLGGLDP